MLDILSRYIRDAEIAGAFGVFSTTHVVNNIIRVIPGVCETMNMTLQKSRSSATLEKSLTRLMPNGISAIRNRCSPKKAKDKVRVNQLVCFREPEIPIPNTGGSLR